MGELFLHLTSNFRAFSFLQHNKPTPEPSDPTWDEGEGVIPRKQQFEGKRGGRGEIPSDGHESSRGGALEAKVTG